MKNNTLPDIGYVRIDDVLTFIPVSRTTWYAGVKSGLYPKPVQVSKGITAWDVDDIRECIEQSRMKHKNRIVNMYHKDTIRNRVPTQILNDERYVELSIYARTLLMDIYSQYNGNNNGQLIATWNFLKSRGWVSRDTIYQKTKELLESGLLILSEPGGQRKATLYSVTFEANESEGQAQTSAFKRLVKKYISRK